MSAMTNNKRIAVGVLAGTVAVLLAARWWVDARAQVKPSPALFDQRATLIELTPAPGDAPVTLTFPPAQNLRIALKNPAPDANAGSTSSR